MYFTQNKKTKAWTAVLAASAMCLALVFAACESATSGNNEAPPKPAASGDGKTYVTFSNRSTYNVNVYVGVPPGADDSALPFAQLPANSEGQKHEIAPSANDAGSSFYIEYLIRAGSISIPYYSASNIKVQKIQAGMENPLAIGEIQGFSSRSIFIVAQNSAESGDIWLQRGGSTVYSSTAYHKKDEEKWIKNGRDAVYEFKSLGNLNEISVKHNISVKALPAVTPKEGWIYTVRYTGTECELLSVAPFDPDMQKKIWSIPTSTENNRFLTVGVFGARKNPADGYLFAGKINYDINNVWLVEDNEDSIVTKPYVALLNTDGSVKAEKTFSLGSNPKTVLFESFVEDGSKILLCGTASYGVDDEKTFVLYMDTSLEMIDYYEGFSTGLSEDEYIYTARLIKGKGSSCLFGATIIDGAANVGRGYLAHVTVNGSNEITHTTLYDFSGDADDTEVNDMLYDSATNSYLVLLNVYVTGTEQVDHSKLVIINADSGAKGQEIAFTSTKYQLEKLLKSRAGAVYTAGLVQNNATGKEVAVVQKINMAGGAVEWTQNLTSADFESAAINLLEDDDGGLIVSGYTGALDNEDFTDMKPWICKFNPVSQKTEWRQVYDAYEGFKVFSVHKNAIGSYLLEIYNGNTYKSYMVSTDLFGDMSGTMLRELPRSAALTIRPAYTVSCDYNDGTGFRYEMVVEAGQSAWLPTPVRNGYLFDYWLDTATSAQYTSAVSMVNRNYNLQAVWKEAPQNTGTGERLEYWTQTEGFISTGETKYYWFPVEYGKGYSISWNDSYEGDDTKTGDIMVSIYWQGTGETIEQSRDSAWYTSVSLSAHSSGVIVLEVTAYTPGSYVIWYSGGW